MDRLKILVVDDESRMRKLVRDFRREGFQLLGGVHGVRNQLAQENFMVRVEEFLDDGENVLRRNSDFSVFHSAIVVVVFDFLPFLQQTVCQYFFSAILSAGPAKTERPVV